jgi:single-stranded-DNA-specific exonuclease
MTSRILKELLAKRHLDPSFLRPQYLSDGELPDMDKAIERLDLALARGEKVMIYGDYDADGVTASTVMYDTLKMFGIKEIEIMLPDRFKDGYGMSQRCVNRAVDDGVSLVITVDCGSNNAEVIELLEEKGIDTIVTDHHELSGAVPVAVAVVNPKRKNCTVREDLQNLAGVGVAFMLARQLALRGKIPEGQEKWLLDLVLIGTICDSMVLTGVNRELCYWGMKVLAKTRRLGLIELMRVAEVKQITAEAIGFQIGPRINAAGRMKSAEIALKLLMTQSRTEAASLANELELLNQQRKTQQLAAVNEVEERGLGEGSVIVASGQWHEGILGIIAGRLVEQYGRPAFALAETEPGIMKGSGRSFGDFSLAEALKACEETIIGGGGHAGACGVKIETAKLRDFQRRINDYHDKLHLEHQERFLECREDLAIENFDELNVELVDELAKLEPYGMGNEEPIFLLGGARVREVQRLGLDEKHLKLVLEDGKNNKLKVLAFYAKEEWLRVREGEEINAWIGLTKNVWNGTESAEGRLVQMRVL